MARLVNVWRDDDPVELASKQMPLVIDENLTVSALARARARTLVRGHADFPDRRPARFPEHVDGDVVSRDRTDPYL